MPLDFLGKEKSFQLGFRVFPGLFLDDCDHKAIVPPVKESYFICDFP